MALPRRQERPRGPASGISWTTVGLVIAALVGILVVWRLWASSVVSASSKESGSAENTLHRKRKQQIPPVIKPQILRKLPFDETAFTQGLVVDGEKGHVWVGTGLNGRSLLRRAHLETHEEIASVKLSDRMFGEGVTVWDGKVYQLTWQDHTGYVYDESTLKQLRTFSYPMQGWGLTHDPEHLILSDGSSTLFFLHPETFKIIRKVWVTTLTSSGSKSVDRLNELEYVDEPGYGGIVYANIWYDDRVAAIDAASGQVLWYLDLSHLNPGHDSEAVVNGVAYDHVNGRMYATGKLWPTLFEIEHVVPPP